MQENAVTKGRGEVENSGGKKSKCRKELSSRQSTQLTRNSYTGRWVGGKWVENREIQGALRRAAN